MNDPVGHTDLYVVGDVHNVIVKQSSEEFTIGVLEKHELGRKRVRKNSLESSTKRPRKESTASEEHNGSTVESEANKSTETSVVDIADDNDDAEVKDGNVEIKVEIKEEDPGWEAEYNPWGVGLSTDDKGDTDASADADAGKPKKLKTHLSKKEKKELDRLEAEEIARAEQRVLDGEEAEPETSDEFDRLVMASPNSSLCW